MIKPFVSDPPRVNPPVAPSLPSILVVDSDESLCQSRALLLANLGRPIHRAAGYPDVCSLSPTECFALVLISLLPSQHEAERIAAYARRQWPGAKLLLLGKLQGEFYDALYDEVLEPLFDPVALLQVSKLLLASSGAKHHQRWELY
jgi:hypothetical protein